MDKDTAQYWQQYLDYNALLLRMYLLIELYYSRVLVHVSRNHNVNLRRRRLS